MKKSLSLSKNILNRMIKNIFRVGFLTLLLSSCGSGSDRGELVADGQGTNWNAEKPYGMVLIPSGSFTMGNSGEDLVGKMNTQSRTVTVRQYFMDETEVTNAEYKMFVEYVRDSVLRTKLALAADLKSYGSEGSVAADNKNLSIDSYGFQAPQDPNSLTPYQEYMNDYYGGTGDVNSETQGRVLDWSTDLVWDTSEYPDVEYVEVMDEMYLPIEETYNGRRVLDVEKFNFVFSSFDNDKAAETGQNRKDFIKREVVNVYPDTTVWIKDFNYSYNDPMHQNYFWHEAYSDYPVIGVTWDQARAFCNWRTEKRNAYLRTRKGEDLVPDFRLPTEAEWEYAARGGQNYSKYPWGGPYTTSEKGCFLANFKPVRGDYAVDGALYTMEAKSYNANDFGLYNMAGNVAEWTYTAYNEASYGLGSTMNPSVEDLNNPKKVIRGGSWKDIAYFMEVSSRDYEYKDTARSYIGFRTVQDYLGK